MLQKCQVCLQSTQNARDYTKQGITTKLSWQKLHEIYKCKNTSSLSLQSQQSQILPLWCQQTASQFPMPPLQRAKHSNPNAKGPFRGQSTQIIMLRGHSSFKASFTLRQAKLKFPWHTLHKQDATGLLHGRINLF